MMATVREATRPAEARGITRDAVRMMVAYRSDLRVVHTHAHDLPQFLDEGDLVVVNTSGTLAAAVDALGEDGTPLVVHLSQQLPAGLWLVELRRPDGGATQPWFDEPPGRALRLIGGGVINLATRFESSQRLWVATLELDVPVLTYLAVHGRPIRYGYVTATGRSTCTRTCTRVSPAARRCRVRGGPSHPSWSRVSWPRGWA